MACLLDVYVMRQALSIDRPFTYYSDREIKPHTRVMVSFNRAKMMGFVTGVRHTDLTLDEYNEKEEIKLLPIVDIVDEEPLMTQELIDLAKWLAKTTISPFITCFNAMLPKAFKVSKTKVGIKMETVIKVNALTKKLTPRQKEVYDSLYDDMPYTEALKLSESIIRRFVSEGIIERYKRPYKPKEESKEKTLFKDLTPDQKSAYEGIIATDKMVSLLFGVTGSGKTEVYLHLARSVLTKGKQVLILVPEIALTPQMIRRVKERFDAVAIYHSYLSDNERYQEYMRVYRGEVSIVIATRSGIFLPFSNLGLIIIDEEHDHSYKQDNVPCYSAKTVAFKRAKDFGCKVLLASATPNIETYTRALNGTYAFFKLSKRINETLPLVEVVDLQKEIMNDGSHIISKTLEDELNSVLNSQKQAIMLLNRRGYAPIVRCASCGSVLMCEDCEMALTYHRDTDELKCNMCGRIYRMIKTCPNCGSSKLTSYGLGTKKVVETLEKMFPMAKVGRMDADNTHIKDGHSKILNDFGEHKYDILVGTQMIAKGLDYPDVTLVGILNADSGLLRTDLNSTETTFDLLMQASGRSGRARDAGKVIIQAFNVDHYVIKAVTRQDYEAFYNIEMNYRHRADLPPYTHFINVILSDQNTKRLSRSVASLDELSKDVSERRFRPFRLNKIMTKERYRFTFVGKNLPELLNKVTSIVNAYLKQSNVSSIKIDVDPVYME